MATVKRTIVAIKDFHRGDTRKYKITVRDGESGDPISIHGGKLYITFKSKKSLIDADAELQVITNGVEADPPNPTGEILAVLTKTDTDIAVGSYYFDFQFVSSTGEVTTILPQETHIDKIKILQDTTLNNA